MSALWILFAVALGVIGVIESYRYGRHVEKRIAKRYLKEAVELLRTTSEVIKDLEQENIYLEDRLKEKPVLSPIQLRP